MAGAYVAKPAVVVVLDLPPGGPDVEPATPGDPYHLPWNPNWPFPGALPPGYTPSYLFSISASGPVNASAGVTRYDNNSNTDAILYDHESYATAKPVGSTITWTATVDGREVMDPITVDYSEDSEGFWGYESIFSFDLIEGDSGRAVELNAVSNAFDRGFSDFTNIPIYDPEYSLSLDTASSVDSEDGISTVEATLYEASTYATYEPASIISWTATIDGDEITVIPVTSPYSKSGDFWGFNDILEFGVGAGDTGRTIVLRGESTVWGGVEVSDTIDIEIDPQCFPGICERTTMKVACEFGQTDLLYSETAATADLDCGDNCVVNNPGCGAASYCRFMDWQPALNGLIVGAPGYYDRSWYVKRYHRPTDQYTDSSAIFPTGKTGLINCDGAIVSTRDTSGTSGMRFADEGLGYELHLFVRCPSYGWTGASAPFTWEKAQQCAEVDCETGACL